MRVFSMLACAVCLFLGVAGCQLAPPLDPGDPREEGVSTRLFTSSVKPVLEHRCLHCHHDEAPNGGLNFQDRDAVVRGDGQGPFLVPGQPEESRIWQAIAQPTSHPRVMPGDGWGLTEAQRKAFRNWIESGADWPEGRTGRLKKKDYQVEIDDYL